MSFFFVHFFTSIHARITCVFHVSFKTSELLLLNASLIRDTLLYQNACFFIKFIKEGGGSNPFIKILAKVWYVMKKAKKSEK